MFAALLIIVALSTVRASQLVDSVPALVWLCERHAASSGSGFPDNWCDANSDVCGWDGVTCAHNGVITSIELIGASVDAPLDDRAYSPGVARLTLPNCGISGMLERAFDGVSNLNLRGNALVGALPNGFFDSLRHVDLSANSLVSVGNLCESSGLRAVSLADNHFSDDLSACADNIAEFGRSLSRLDLSDNSFAGVAPAAPSLQFLKLSSNNFASIANALPMKRINSALYKFGTDDEDRIALKVCEIDASAFADGSVDLSSQWFHADSEVSAVCK